MRVVVLGAGGMGRYAASTAINFEFVDELIVGDIDERAAVAATILSAPAVGVGGATGVRLAVGLATLRPEGDLRRGVFPAEAMIDPREFFDELAPLCSPAKTGTDDLLLISRSWENVDLREKLRAVS